MRHYPPPVLIYYFSHQVTNASGQTVEFQVSPVFDKDYNAVPDSFRVSVLRRRLSAVSFKLNCIDQINFNYYVSFKVHFVAHVPPLGLATYTVEETSSANSLSSVSLYNFVGDVSVEYVLLHFLSQGQSGRKSFKEDVFKSVSLSLQ
jgi:hypothetical protein